MPVAPSTQQRLEIALASSQAAADLLAVAAAGAIVAQSAPAAASAYTAGTTLVGVDGTGSNAAPLAGANTRLAALDARCVALTTLVNSLRTALIAAGVLV